MITQDSDGNRMQRIGQNKTHQLEQLDDMVKYCQNETTCRRTLQLGFFGETFHRKNCGPFFCDNCRSLSEHGATLQTTRNVTEIAKAIVGLTHCVHPTTFTWNQLKQYLVRC